MTEQSERLAIRGGVPIITSAPKDLFRWPLLDGEDETAVLSALRDADFPNDALIRGFEEDLASWIGVRHVSAESSATSGIAAALFACGVGPGDEVIVPACTYWATCMPVLTFGAVPVFCDIDPSSLNIDPKDIARRVSPRTKAIVVAHLLGQPCDMETINDIAGRAGIPVIEDAAHAFGSIFRGQKIGRTADICVFSFSRKALSLSEGGAVVTDQQHLFERLLAWGHTERFHRGEISSPELLRYANVPLGGITSRMHVMSAAMGRVQLARIDGRIAEINAAMQLFCDLLDGLDCVTPVRTSQGSGSTMGSWYTPHALYDSNANYGLSLEQFKRALVAEGFDTWTWAGFSHPLHLHPVFQSANAYGHRLPNAFAPSGGDGPRAKGSLPSAEAISAFALPAFRRYDEAVIHAHADAVAKVVEATPSLLAAA